MRVCVCLCVIVWETVARNVRRVLLPHNNLTIELEYCAYDACCQEISLYAALSGVLFTRSAAALELLEFSVPLTHTNTHTQWHTQIGQFDIVKGHLWLANPANIEPHWP